MSKAIRDIDLIIEKIRQQLPEVAVWQEVKIHPADDDGIWFFYYSRRKPDIQLESSLGMCPFMVVTDEYWGANAKTANTIDEAVSIVVDCLISVKDN